MTEIVCRICLESDRDMISPCMCNGTLKYVHMECLEQWRRGSIRNTFQCQTCRFIYRTENQEGFTVYQIISFTLKALGRTSAIILPLQIIHFIMCIFTIGISLSLHPSIYVGRSIPVCDSDCPPERREITIGNLTYSACDIELRPYAFLKGPLGSLLYMAGFYIFLHLLPRVLDCLYLFLSCFRCLFISRSPPRILSPHFVSVPENVIMV